jgi:hypothetical protein
MFPEQEPGAFDLIGWSDLGHLPVDMVEDLKILANQRDVSYQSLLKVFLAERLEREKMRRLAV